MFMPLQVILLVLIVLLYPITSGVSIIRLSPAAVLAIVLLTQALPVFFAWRRTRLARRPAGSQGGSRESDPVARAQFPLRLARLRNMVIMILAADLWLLGFGRLVWVVWRLHRWPLVAQVIWLIPPALSWLGIWSVSYRTQARLHAQRAAANPHIPSYGYPSRPAYLWMQMRHNILPALLLLGMQSLISLVLGGFWVRQAGYWAIPLGLAMVLSMIIFLPWALVRIWDTRPLGPGTPRKDFEDIAGRWRICFSDIRVWNTHHLVPNAAIISPVRWFRYFLLTDLLLENFNTRELRAVFAHEVGHARHRHILWYFAAIIAIQLFCGDLARSLTILWPHQRNLWTVLEYMLLMVFLVWGFSRISRLCEHQADWFAARQLAEEPLSSGESGVTPPAAVPLASVAGYLGWRAPREAAAPAAVELYNYYDCMSVFEYSPAGRDSPLLAGARTFSTALLHLAALADISPGRAGWMHPSIHARVTLLGRLAQSPEAQRDFQRRIRRLHWLIIMAVLVAIGLTAAL